MEYTIDAVARLTGISAFTLRNWEKRYDFLKPRRMENGFRAYDDKHIELLKKVSVLIKHGAKIGDLAESIRKGRPLPEVQTPELAPEVQEQARGLYQALTKYDVERAEMIHSELAARFSTPQMLDLVYTPLLARMGKDWSQRDTSPAQEHFASAFIRLRLAPYLSLLATSPGGSRRKVLCATLSGELHEGGLMIIAAHLKLKGWATYYFGPNLPIEDIIAASQAIQPNTVCLSFSDSQGLRSAIPQLARIPAMVSVGGFGALTFDGEEALPPNVQLIKKNGKEAADMVELLERSAQTAYAM